MKTENIIPVTNNRSNSVASSRRTRQQPHPVLKGPLMLIIFLALGIYGFSQIPPPDAPDTVTVRFANPNYDCETEVYCLDVEFQCNLPNDTIVGVNLRFLYDDSVLEFDSIGDFVAAYNLPAGESQPVPQTGQPGSGVPFGFSNVADYLNGRVVLRNFDNGIPTATQGWTKLFKVCFTVDDVEALTEPGGFCPSIVWDLNQDSVPPDPNDPPPGFIPGSDGVVITLRDGNDTRDSEERVVFYNWDYQSTTEPFGQPQPADCTFPDCFELGDAPELAIAYPSSGTTGYFPTCVNDGNNKYIMHVGQGGYFGTFFDFEIDGNQNLCSPSFTVPYDNDEAFNDANNDAGLIKPVPYTITAGIIVPLQGAGGALDTACGYAEWGKDIDIAVTGNGYVNVLVDWDMDGQWGGGIFCQNGAYAPEHALVNHPVTGNAGTNPLSAFMSPGEGFQVGRKGGYVWVRFTITNEPITAEDWDGSGEFLGGETEDYLMYVKPPASVPLSNWAVFITIFLIAVSVTIFFRRKI